jgi:hypothetical protein
MSMRHPAGSNAGHVRGHRPGPKVRNQTRRPAAPPRLRQMYEDEDDSFDVPETALGAAKE